VKTERMSLEEFRQLHAGQRKPKFGSVSTIEDGYRFDSKLEARRYRYWANLWQCGAIGWFTRQVPFYLPGGIVYRADFLIAMLPGDTRTFRVEDCKGVMSRVSINKIKQVEQIYGFKVQIIKTGDFT
jgi:hypothetical protein